MARTLSCNLIGISGKIGSGKDTFAKMILLAIWQNQWPNLFEKMSLEERLKDMPTGVHDWYIKKFADKLKEIVCILIGCNRNQLEDQRFKDSNLPDEWDRLFWQENGAIRPTKFPATNFFRVKFPSARAKSMTVREMLQLVGTDCMRDNLHPQVWVNALFSSWNKRSIETYSTYHGSKEAEISYDNKWIITDVRFPNEFEAIKERGGIMIRISRPAELYGGVVSNHESETALDHYKPFETWDEYIKNTGTLSNLYEVAKEIVTKYNLK